MGMQLSRKKIEFTSAQAAPATVIHSCALFVPTRCALTRDPPSQSKILKPSQKNAEFLDWQTVSKPNRKRRCSTISPTEEALWAMGTVNQARREPRRRRSPGEQDHDAISARKKSTLF